MGTPLGPGGLGVCHCRKSRGSGTSSFFPSRGGSFALSNSPPSGSLAGETRWYLTTWLLPQEYRGGVARASCPRDFPIPWGIPSYLARTGLNRSYPISRRCTSLYIVAELEARLRAAAAAQICGAQACAPQLCCCSCCMNSQACEFMHIARSSNKFRCLYPLLQEEQLVLVCTSLYAPAAVFLATLTSLWALQFDPFAWIVRTSLYARSFHAVRIEDRYLYSFYAAHKLVHSSCFAAERGRTSLYVLAQLCCGNLYPELYKLVQVLFFRSCRCCGATSL
jgi:hypothetical protein